MVENGQHHSQRPTRRTRHITGRTATASVPARARASHSTTLLVVSTSDAPPRGVRSLPVSSPSEFSMTRRVWSDMTWRDQSPVLSAPQAKPSSYQRHYDRTHRLCIRSCFASSVRSQSRRCSSLRQLTRHARGESGHPWARVWSGTRASFFLSPQTLHPCFQPANHKV
jgi:hypothetical protein